MKNCIYTFALALTCLLASCIVPTRQTQFINISADSLRAQVINLDEYKTKYAKYDGVYLDVDDRREHYLGVSGWELYRVRTIKYVVLNPNEESLTTFKVVTDRPETLTGVFMHVYSPDGTIRKYGSKDLLVENSSGGSHTYKFAYPDVKAGTIIEEGFELRHSNAIQPVFDHDIPLQFSMPCEHLYQAVTYPRNWVLQMKRIAPGTIPGTTRKESPDGKFLTISYEGRNLPAREDEMYSPYFKEFGQYYQMMFTYLNTGGGTYNAPDSWSKVANQWTKYVLDKESFWSSSVRQAMKEASKEAKTNEEKFESIITYVQDNIKLSQSASTEDFTDVLNRKEANWYMMTSLAHAMLNKADVKADFLLIHSARDGYFDQDYITIDQIYIPAITAEINGKTYVAFPWMKYLPVTIIPEYFQGQQALKISQKGFNGFMKVPVSEASAKDNITEENYNVHIDDEGLLTVQEEKTFHGTNAFNLRQELVDLKKDELDKEVKKLLTYSEGDVKIKNYTIENLQDFKKPLQIKLEYTIDNLVTVTPEEVIFQTGGLFSPSSTGGDRKVDTAERRNPIRIYNDEQTNKNITVNYPMSWQLSSQLTDVNRANDFGSVAGQYENTPGKLSVKQTRMLKQSSAPKEKFPELLELISRQSKLAIPTIIFKVGS